MSLKGFHIVFITVVTFLFIAFAFWGLYWAPEKSTLFTVIGVIGMIGALLTPVYGVVFYRKMNRFSSDS